MKYNHLNLEIRELILGVTTAVDWIESSFPVRSPHGPLRWQLYRTTCSSRSWQPSLAVSSLSPWQHPCAVPWLCSAALSSTVLTASDAGLCWRASGPHRLWRLWTRELLSQVDVCAFPLWDWPINKGNENLMFLLLLSIYVYKKYRYKIN